MQKYHHFLTLERTLTDHMPLNGEAHCKCLTVELHCTILSVAVGYKETEYK